MHVHDQARPEPTPIPGVAHATWAGSAEGLSELSLFNTGPLPLELIGIFAATPVPVQLPDGQALALPWRS